jgi:hypothetical protein
MLKKISLIVALLVAGNVHAQSIVNDLVGIGFESNKATVLKESFNSKIPEDARFLTGKTIAIQEATAASACSGTVTANGTTAVTVSTTCATTGSRILIARNAAPSGTAICWTANIVNGTSFDLDCSAAETSTFNWFIIHEAP